MADTSSLGGPLPGYLRFGTIAGGTVAFVTDDDLWTVPAGGGPARRITADLVGISHPVLSPDGQYVSFTSDAQGQAEIYVVPAGGGMARRLTWLGPPRPSRGVGAGRPTKVLTWARDGRVVFASETGQPFPTLTMAYAIAPDGAQPPEALPFGPLRDLSYGPAAGAVLGRNTADLAVWKRYRGGTAGSLWIDREGNGDFRPLLRPETLGGNLASPMWVGERVYFLSDHEGIGNLYSCSLDGADVARHTDHGEHYARLASSDGRRIVYQVAARLWVYDPGTDRSEEVQVDLGSPRTQRQPHFVAAGTYLGHYSLDKTGEHLALDARGKLFSLGPFDGPVVQHGRSQGTRYRLASFLGGGPEIVTVSHATGAEAIEVHRRANGATSVEALEVAGLGRVVELAPSPDGDWVAVANHKHQLVVAPAGGGESRVVDESQFGMIRGLAWSPDGKWLAYSYPASALTSQIKLAGLQNGSTFAATLPLFRDFCPSWDPTGKYMYFLSTRTFDPVYDSIFFDLGFPLGGRPYLVTLQADAPSPFVVRPQPEKPEPVEKKGAASVEDGGGASPPQSGPVRVDLDGITARAVAVPVPEARYEKIVALKDKLLMLSRPPEGALHRSWTETVPHANGALELYDLVEDHRDTLLTEVSEFALSADGERLAFTTSGGANPGGSDGGERRLRIVASSAKPDPEAAQEPPGRRSGFVDLGRVRVLVDPGAEWAQMVREAWRLQPEHFWAEDLSGVDWDKVLERYLPLVELVATRAELSDLIWEMQGELGTSHAYEAGGEYRQAPPWGQAHLGADLARDADGAWVVSRIVPGSSWQPEEASPLLTPGAGIEAGTAIAAVNGQPVDPSTGPGPLLANQAGMPVELTLLRAGESPRQVVVPTLSNETPLRYRAWVDANRDRVAEATGGRAGYLHIPDMGPHGWSEFHRSYLSEVLRDALVVDIRFNAGGHVSALILEKLARRRIGWDVPRRGALVPYPEEAPVGPLVLLTNEWAGSDGDIFTHGWKAFGLGPVVGTRTWGGVIGIDITQPLVDGSFTTQPQYAFWFDAVGWGVENHGVDPDEEVLFAPQDYAAQRDPQLSRAIELVSDALGRYQLVRPDLGARPAKPLPVLPARN